MKNFPKAHYWSFGKSLHWFVFMLVNAESSHLPRENQILLSGKAPRIDKCMKIYACLESNITKNLQDINLFFISRQVLNRSSRVPSTSTSTSVFFRVVLYDNGSQLLGRNDYDIKLHLTSTLDEMSLRCFRFIHYCVIAEEHLNDLRIIKTVPHQIKYCHLLR